MYIAIIYVVIMKNNADLPRERILNIGAAALADFELLSLLLGFGGKDLNVFDVSKKLLNTFGGLKGLSQVTSTQLISTKYIGKSKAATLLAMNEIALRIMTLDNNTLKTKLSTPKDVYEILRRNMYMKKRECLYLLSLDVHNNLIEKDLISVGTIRETLVSPREIYRQALARNAVSIILAHNHPSNNPHPSSADIELTEQVALVGKQLDISLLDHVIICDHEYCSIKSLDLFTLNNKGGDKNDNANKAK